MKNTRAVLQFVLLMLVAVVASGAATPGHLVKAGRPQCVIVLPDDATPGEQYAAHELRDHVRKITGAELPQLREGEYAAAAGPAVHVGRTARSAEHVTDEKLTSLGDDGFMIFTRNGDCFLLGGRKRGAIYAVDEFLEAQGVRWYAPDFAVVPRQADIGFPAAPVEAVPRFWYRDQWWNNAATAEWLVRQRINGNNGQNHEVPAALGGSVVTLYACHSYKELVPPAEHFERHREWFAVKEKGARDGKNELCLTNPELRAFVAQKVLADLRGHAGAVDNYWVSQNDGGRSGCFCERCTAERQAHGGADRWSANTISFASHVADQVRAEFPRVRIKTLAYSYTQEAPENLIAAPTVLVEICGNFGAGADDRQRQRVAAWAKVARNISAYTYGGSNYGYWWPYPNVTELGEQCPRALASGVTVFYMQGTALGHGSGLVDLKAYVSARLAWDPTRDVRQEIREFCAGFYGPGGCFIVEYLDWYGDYIRRNKLELDGGWGDTERWRKWVTPEAMTHAEGLFQQALQATKDQPVFLRHVRQAYLEVLCGRVLVNLQPKTGLLDKDLALIPNADGAAVKSRAALFGEIMRENGYDMWSEVVPFDPAEYAH